MIVHKSRKKAVCITVAGFLAGIAGGLSCTMSAMRFLAGVSWRRRVLPFYTVSARCTTADPISYLPKTALPRCSRSAGRSNGRPIRYADDFYFRGQYWVRLLLESNYKPQLIRPAWFWRFDRLYESKGVKAVYLRTMGLEMDSMQLVALIRRMKEADVPGRIELLNGCLLK